MALKLAKYAVNTTPSEFLTWAKLTDGKLGTSVSWFLFLTAIVVSLYRYWRL